MKQPEISIVIPIYNVEPYLEESLQSVLSQTFGHEKLQVIMVNDNSTDKSGAIMEEYSSRYNHFISIHLPERSGAAGKPRNVGLERADGKYIMFLDPDDQYEPDAVETLYNKITRDNSDIVVGMYRYNYDKQERFGKFLGNSELHLEDIEEFPQILEMPPAIWSKIFKTELIRNHNLRFPERIAAQDLVFSVNSYLHARKISFVERVVYNYRVRDKEDKSISNNLSVKYFQDLNCALLLTYKICKTQGKTHLFKYIIKDKVDFFLNKIVVSKLSRKELIDLLSLMQWLFKELAGFEIGGNWKKWLLHDLINGEIGRSVDGIETIRYFRKYIENIEEGKQWLEQQLKNHQIEMQNQKVYIEEMEDLKTKLFDQIEAKNRDIQEIEKGKQWLEQQLKNHQIEMQNQKRYIEEMEDVKQKLFEQIESKDKIIQELSRQKQSLEKDIEKLKNESAYNENRDKNTFAGRVKTKIRNIFN